MDNLFLKIWSDHDTACDERDGCKVPFKSERIKEAILRAAKAAEVDDADYCATVAAVVSEQMQGRNQVDINEIQTAVENQLMSGPYKQLARAYIEYRHDRDIDVKNAVA
ncbi:Anaerobic ribonucleoside-triphosphate reductase [Escherichia coli]|nr:Anaerobic ribonucleoside-triphosphate reductase [Escherichia coli]